MQKSAAPGEGAALHPTPRHTVILSASGRKPSPTKKFKLTELARSRAGQGPSRTWLGLQPRSLSGRPSVWDQVKTDSKPHPVGKETLVSEGVGASGRLPCALGF